MQFLSGHTLTRQEVFIRISNFLQPPSNSFGNDVIGLQICVVLFKCWICSPSSTHQMERQRQRELESWAPRVPLSHRSADHNLSLFFRSRNLIINQETYLYEYSFDSTMTVFVTKCVSIWIEIWWRYDVLRNLHCWHQWPSHTERGKEDRTQSWCQFPQTPEKTHKLCLIIPWNIYPKKG